MTQKTCAACDYPLDANAIKVNIGGKTVEVCCEECAVALREAHASASGSSKLPSLLLASLLVLSAPLTAYAATAVIQIADTDSGPLTLTGAKRLVSKILVDNGEGQLRPGSAKFDRDGNVAVEVVNSQGITIRHVVVDTKTRGVAYAGTGTPLAKKS